MLCRNNAPVMRGIGNRKRSKFRKHERKLFCQSESYEPVRSLTGQMVAVLNGSFVNFRLRYLCTTETRKDMLYKKFFTRLKFDGAVNNSKHLQIYARSMAVENATSC